MSLGAPAPEPVLRDLEGEVGAPVRSCRPVAGGDIHRAFRVELEGGRVLFVKTSPDTPPGLFAAEARALGWLASFGALATPEVIAARDRRPGVSGYLALSWIDARTRGDEAALGRGLAALHDAPLERPGWERDGFIGPLPQRNDPPPDGGTVASQWARFWIERRLRPMATLAAPHLGPGLHADIEHVCGRCEAIVGELPRLSPLHGDLWSGNVMHGPEGPVLIDPAVYAGDPEVDLAMMDLFGGFGAAFWRTYERRRPPRPGWRARRELYKLWPLLVHVALFGRGYLPGVERAVRALL